MLAAALAAGANIIGGIIGNNAAEKQAKQNIKLQKDFAQQGIRWKVADAKAAGIHPLAALGAQTHSYAPQVGGTGNVGTGLAAAGQDIARGINATRSDSERVDAYTKTIQDLNIQRMGLENEMLGSQIAKINQAGTPPAMPTAGDRYLIDGQGNSGLVKTTPLSRMSVAPGQPSAEAGAIADSGYTRTPTGWAPVMSKDAKDRLEEDAVGTLGWNIRNRLAPTLGFPNNPPSSVPLSDGETWYYNPATQEYVKGPKMRSLTRTWNGKYNR